jgi:hypothetical protein
MILIAALVSLWFIQRQRRMERNARLDRTAVQARRLLDFVGYGQYDLERECDRYEAATRWLMEISRRKKTPREAEEALQEFAARLKRMAAKVRVLRQAGSKGGEDRDVTFIEAEQAQVLVALAQLRGGAGEVREALAQYVHSLRRYRDAVREFSPPDAAGRVLPQIKLAAARGMQAEWNRDRQTQAAALGEHLSAIQEFARLLSQDESNAMGVLAAESAAARVRAKLAAVLQDEVGERAGWEDAFAKLRKLHSAESDLDEDASSSHVWTGGEFDFAIRLPQPSLLLDDEPREHLSQEAKSLELAVLEELAAICSEAARQAALHNEGQAEVLRDSYWAALKALADCRWENASAREL